jgi:hypothetical protein
MPTKVKTQKDYLLTEVTIELPASVAELDAIMKATKASAKVTVLYNEGSILGINVEQKKKASDLNSGKMRDLLGVQTTSL